jgi:hypothetical protein
METLTQCIKSVTDNFKLSDVKREMIYEDGGEKYIFSRWNYIYAFYQTIDNFYDQKIYMPNFIELIYSMATGKYINQLCTGIINIYGSENMSTESQNEFNYITDKYKFNEFLKEFHNRITEEDCKFTSLALSYHDQYGSHRNMLLIYRDDINENINVSLYEPHGYNISWYNQKDPSNMYQNIENFVRNLILEYNSAFREYKIKRQDPITHCNTQVIKSFFKRDVLDFVTKPNRIGIQAYVNEMSYGYCVMYSYFWLYLVLHCYKQTGLDFRYISNKIEECLIEMYTPEKLGMIISAFAGKAINFYIEDLEKHPDKEYKKYFYTSLENQFKSNIITRKIYRKKKKSKLTPQRKEHGEDCEKHEDCGSNYCDKNFKCGESIL